MAISKIGSKGLQDSDVAAADIAPGTVTNDKLAGSIANAKLANNSVTINSETIALGGSSTISVKDIEWQSVITADGSTGVTMVAGRGYFVDTTSGTQTMTLPSSASAGDLISIKDYAGTFNTNALTVARNGHNIQGFANDSVLDTNRASLTLVYVDATKGWLYVNESNVSGLVEPLYTVATGGTITTDGNFKLHTFLSDGCFVVSQVGNSPNSPTGGPNVVDYLVVAGGGGGIGQYSGGGAGGFRMSIHTTPTPNPLNAATPNPARTISAQTYPISVGAGGTGSPGSTPGSNSVFNTITSAGGGGNSPKDGGSGSGASGEPPNPGTNPKGSGNTPPVSPPQGNPGGPNSPNRRGGGGGGAGAAGASAGGGAGSYVPTTFLGPTAPTRGEPGPNGRYFAGGGGGGTENTPGSPYAGGLGGGGNGGNASNGTAGSTNMGGGGGSGSRGTGTTGSYGGAAGGSGIVILRYQFQAS